jgi:hypothetical protein
MYLPCQIFIYIIKIFIISLQITGAESVSWKLMFQSHSIKIGEGLALSTKLWWSLYKCNFWLASYAHFYPLYVANAETILQSKFLYLASLLMLWISVIVFQLSILYFTVRSIQMFLVDWERFQNIKLKSVTEIFAE